jgi:hypothetical protein
MMRLGFLAATAFVILAGPAAAARCNQPYAPVVKIGAAATKQDVAAVHDDVVSFIKASDLYQSCLVSHEGDSALIDANQAEKERIGREYNVLWTAFKAAHPGVNSLS